MPPGSRSTWLAISALLPICQPAQATDVSGTIATQTWYKGSGPYRVTGTITVPAGNTLTIEPGVDVLFDADGRSIPTSDTSLPALAAHRPTSRRSVYSRLSEV